MASINKINVGGVDYDLEDKRYTALSSKVTENADELSTQGTTLESLQEQIDEQRSLVGENNNIPAATGYIGKLFIAANGRVYIETPLQGSSPAFYALALEYDLADLIRDGQLSGQKTWSSSKINTELNAVANNCSELIIGSWKHNGSAFDKVSYSNIIIDGAVCAFKLYKSNGQCVMARADYLGAYRHGDANLDGKVDNDDKDAIMDIIGGKLAKTPTADIDLDGRISIFDSSAFTNDIAEKNFAVFIGGSSDDEQYHTCIGVDVKDGSIHIISLLGVDTFTSGDYLQLVKLA